MTTATAENKAKAPVQTFRHGRIQAAIFLNETARGTRHNVVLSRGFKRNRDADWEQSNSFGREDALAAARLLERAVDWINDHVEPVRGHAAPDQATDAEPCPVCHNPVPAGRQRCDSCGTCVTCD
jgi:hypothetical protein